MARNPALDRVAVGQFTQSSRSGAAEAFVDQCGQFGRIDSFYDRAAITSARQLPREGKAVGCQHWTIRRHRFEHDRGKALINRGQHKEPRPGVPALYVGDEARHDDPILKAKLFDQLLKRRTVRSVTQDRQTRVRIAHEGEGADQPLEPLLARQPADGEHERRVIAMRRAAGARDH